MTRTVRGARVVIVGASGQLGRAFAARAVSEHARGVVLWDGDETVHTLATELRAHVLAQSTPTRPPDSARRDATTVLPFAVPPGELGGIAQAAHAVRTGLGSPDVLILTAHTAQVSAMVEVYSAMHVVREFLPGMITSGRAARIVVVDVETPGSATTRSAALNAARFALRGWSAELSTELRVLGHDLVRVTFVSPGAITSGMFELPSSAARPVVGPLSDERRVDRIWNALLRGTPHVAL